MFLHGGLGHLLGNLLFLWVFGNNVEDAMGHLRFLGFYLLCGVAAVIAQVLPDPTSNLPMVGASGAISGVLGAYMLLYPRARVLLALPPPFIFITIGWFRAIWVLAGWFALQLLMGAGVRPPEGEAGGVAFGAHIGGFVAGMVLIPLFKRRRRAAVQAALSALRGSRRRRCEGSSGRRGGAGRARDPCSFAARYRLGENTPRLLAPPSIAESGAPEARHVEPKPPAPGSDRFRATKARTTSW
jgi:membrane associated rhomboid family serine protease